jgi:succinyl-diaminopimelate desuccinylase
LARTLVRANTVNPPGNERALAELLARRLDTAGLEVTLHELGAERANVVARSPSRERRPALCLTGHLDVVPVGEASWTRDPFGAEVDGDRLYGRGSSDMKGGVAAIVAAVERLAGGWDGADASVEVALTSGEESGCEGAKALTAPGMLGTAGALLVAEPTANQPRIAHKGVLWLRALSRGRQAHGAAPDQGSNAVVMLARAVAALEGLDLDAPEHPLLDGPTVNVGSFHGGRAPNSVPDGAVAQLDVRLVPGLEVPDVIAALREQMGAGIELEPTLLLPPVETDPDDPWVAEVFDVLTPLLGERPEPTGIAPFTDASVLAIGYGWPPAIVCGPGEPTQAHRTDEWCSIARIEQAVDAYTEIARRWCGL